MHFPVSYRYIRKNKIDYLFILWAVLFEYRVSLLKEISRMYEKKSNSINKCSVTRTNVKKVLEMLSVYSCLEFNGNEIPISLPFKSMTSHILQCWILSKLDLFINLVCLIWRCVFWHLEIYRNIFKRTILSKVSVCVLIWKIKRYILTFNI